MEPVELMIDCMWKSEKLKQFQPKMSPGSHFQFEKARPKGPFRFGFAKALTATAQNFISEGHPGN